MNFKKHITTLSSIAFAGSIIAQSSQPIILSETAVDNLSIQTVEASPSDFTQSLFAIGRIAPIPANKSVLSSRVPGRVVTLNAFEGDIVKAGQTLVEIESTLAGNPPPVIPLKAPLPGMVMQSHTHLGKPVAQANELFEIIDLKQVYAVARVPEDQAGSIQIGSLANIHIAALSQKTVRGELVRYGTEANPVSGTLDAYFILDNADYRLRPGMRAEFAIETASRENTLSVPKDSIQSDGIDHFVFVEDFDLPNAFVKVPVLTGTRNETHVEIMRGLFPGDRVVTNGSYALMFAGSGSVSLKEALDSAHGHEHNEDGSEQTAEQKRSNELEKSGSSGTSPYASSFVWFLSILSVSLFGLLVLSLSIRKRS